MGARYKPIILVYVISANWAFENFLDLMGVGCAAMSGST